MSILLDDRIREALHDEAHAVDATPDLADLADRISVAPTDLVTGRRFGRRAFLATTAAAASVLFMAGGAAAMLNNEVDDDVRVQMPAEAPKSTTTVPKTTTSLAVVVTTLPLATTVPAAPTINPPGLEMVSPPSGSQAAVGTEVKIYGRTEPGAQLTVDGAPVYVNGAGEFEFKHLVSVSGGKKIIFTAKFPNGPTTEVPYYVKGMAPKTEKPPTTSKPKTENPGTTHAWTAIQTYGSSSEAAAFDVFYGTAKPGSSIKIYSNYGYTYTTANSEGVWSVRAEFTTTRGQTIPVSAKNRTTGQSTEFSFTHTA